MNICIMPVNVLIDLTIILFVLMIFCLNPLLVNN
jgi:hypothetical protein